MISKVNVGNLFVRSQEVSSNKKIDTKDKKIENTKKQESRVEEIKKSIQDGTYRIDLQKTAKKVADTLL